MPLPRHYVTPVFCLVLSLACCLPARADDVSGVSTRDGVQATPAKGFRLFRKNSRNETKVEGSDGSSPDSSDENKWEEKVKAPPVNLRGAQPYQPIQTDDALLKLVDQAIYISSHRFLNTAQHSPWQIMHGMLALRHDYRIYHDRQVINTVQWLTTKNPMYAGEYMFERTPDGGGRMHKYSQPYHFEGHPNQFLGFIAMLDLPRSYAFRCNDGGQITIEQLIHFARSTVNDREETAWTLWFLAQYTDPEEVWQNNLGEYWSIERLVQDQIATDLSKSACGGTHSLFAQAFARNHLLHRKPGPLRGVWLESEQKLARYMAEAQAIQYRDGSFPTKYFRGVGTATDVSTMLASSGHMMEWLMMALPDSRLDETWVRNGLNHIARTMINYRTHEVATGPLYHAVDALVIYRDRMKARAAGPKPTAPAGNSPLARAIDARPSSLARIVPEIVTFPPPALVAVPSAIDDPAYSARQIPTDAMLAQDGLHAESVTVSTVTSELLREYFPDTAADVEPPVMEAPSVAVIEPPVVLPRTPVSANIEDAEPVMTAELPPTGELPTSDSAHSGDVTSTADPVVIELRDAVTGGPRLTEAASTSVPPEGIVPGSSPGWTASRENQEPRIPAAPELPDEAFELPELGCGDGPEAMCLDDLADAAAEPASNSQPDGESAADADGYEVPNKAGATVPATEVKWRRSRREDDSETPTGDATDESQDADANAGPDDSGTTAPPENTSQSEQAPAAPSQPAESDSQQPQATEEGTNPPKTDESEAAVTESETSSTEAAFTGPASDVE